MKRIIAVFMVFTLLVCAFCSCVHTPKMFDYDRAQIKLPDGEVIEILIDSYWVGSNHVNVLAKDGRRYAVSKVNIVFIGEDKDD